jgi:hypothetical protein
MHKTETFLHYAQFFEVKITHKFYCSCAKLFCTEIANQAFCEHMRFQLYARSQGKLLDSQSTLPFAKY